MAAIDTSLLPSGNVRFQMAAMPEPTDPLVEEQRRLANQTAAQNLATAKYNAQKQKLFDAMADVVQHETPADTNAAIDRYVADGTLTPEQAADAKSKVPPMDENGNFDKDAFNKYKLNELLHYSSNVESVIKGLQENQRQQQISRILGLDAAPAPAAPTNALAPAPVDKEQALFNQLNPQPAAPAAAPTTNALVSSTAQGVDVNALRNRINALYMMGEDKLAASLEKQIPEDTGPKLGTYQPGDYTIESWAKFEKTKNPADLRYKRTAAEITAATAGTTQIPKLKQGERWNPTQERVEQVPGSAEYIKQSKLHGTDYGAVQAVNSKTELADKQIDRLLSPANEDAFNNLFGGYGAYVTQQFSGKTADLKSDLDSLKQNLKSAGLELIKSGGGGAIGTITEREWPILEGMIESLSPKMSESDARAKLEAIKAKMANIRAMAADKYDTTWGETQYYKGASSAPVAAGGAQTPAVSGQTRKTKSGVTYTVE